MALLILGSGTLEYLETVSSYLNICDISCDLRQEGRKHKLTIDTFLSDPFEIDCFCEEISPTQVVRQIKAIESEIRISNQIINVLQIKQFSAFRYNVDEAWDGLERWKSVDVYQRSFQTMRERYSKSAKTGWVLSGAEKIGMASSFFKNEKNKEFMNISPHTKDSYSSADIHKVMEQFLKDIGEERFYKNIQDHEDIVGLAFSRSNSDNSLISEGTSIFWTLYSFLSVIDYKEMREIVFRKDFFDDK